MGYRTSQFAQPVNQLKPQEASCHCQAFLATLMLIGGLAAGLILFLKHNPTLPL